MSAYFVQFLYGTDEVGNPSEIINGARTLALLQANMRGSYGQFLDWAGCSALALAPCTILLTPPVTITATPWAPLDFSITAAPWYNASVPASSEAFGFTIDDWSGLDGGHYARHSMPVSAGRGGSWYGPLTGKGRVWKMNVVLHASTERGMNYLYRWLEQQLIGCCSSTNDARVWIREFCPSSLTDPEEGMAAGERVTLLEGPTWERPPLETQQCVIRMLSFTLGVGDPCLYRPVGATTASNPNVATSLGASIWTSLGAQGDGPDSEGNYVEAPCHRFAGSSLRTSLQLPQAVHGKMSGIVTITTPAEYGKTTAPALRILGYYDRNGTGTTDPCAGSEVSEIIIQGMVPGDVVEVDLGRRRVRRRGGPDSSLWTDASYLIARVEPFNPWSSFSPCDAATITVEPAYVDQFSQVSTTMCSMFSVVIQSQEHVGCPC